MVSVEEIVSNILDLTESQFFAADRAVLGPRESRLLDLDFFGVVVNAPKRIVTSRQHKLPLIMAMRTSGERGWDVGLAANCVLVGANLQDGSVRFAQALVSEKEQISRGREEEVPRGPRPPGLADAGAQLAELDVRSRLDIPWSTGTWALSVIHYDWPSNAAIVELHGDQPAQSSAARSVHPALEKHAGTLPSYLPMSETPSPPDSGISFTLDCAVEGGRQRLSVLGSFVIPVRACHLPRQTLVHEYSDELRESVQAVIPVTLAVLALGWDEPLVFDWAVPVYGAPLEVGAPARGCFAIDALAAAGGNELSPGEYVCFIVLEGTIFGPQTLRVPNE